ncbi:cytochrome P450 [Conexibacter sp. SYSU D00693]|uniref:cytochrome P450 n=1 Tax=Conexibacter sp. SYSU D00693 TaxID=2812560 RepID=UPI00196A57D5|nr:cytochrome P450 [Conexibacter sp. SYSU D00693]
MSAASTTMTVQRPEEAGRLLTDPATYADERLLHEVFTLLRRESPVHRVEAPGFNPFWAITKHADLTEVEARNDVFINAPRPILQSAEADHLRAQRGSPIRSLVHMDEPEHRAHRAITQAWFQPRGLARIHERVGHLARSAVARMAEMPGECDVVRDVAMHYPLQVILSVLGLPESDFERMLGLTQQMFGEQDPELRRSASAEERLAVFEDFFAYFSQLAADRRRTPTEDLASVIANAKVDGRPLDDMAVMSYYVLIATAGHDTTSSTLSGGLLALLEHPDQLARLRAEPELLPTAVDEMLRWVSPVKQFVRTATEDYTLRGVTIRAGEAVTLCYPSANRDEEVFERPDEFDVARRPNRHRAFGSGIHACLGAQLARMELREFFGELLPRLASIELAGPPARVHTLFVGGLKRLPVRYELR